ncbi:MAG: hypothetical protein ACRCZF_03955, partial [Gemmataceae bacterium]
EPRLQNVALLLGGGGLVDAFWNHPQARQYRWVFEYFGWARPLLRRWIAPADPITYARQLRSRRLLLIGAAQDDVVLPVALESLWVATDRPKRILYPGTHVGVVLHVMPALHAVLDHVRAAPGTFPGANGFPPTSRHRDHR